MLLSVWGIYQKNYIQGCCYWQKCLGLKSKHGYPDAQPGTPTLLDILPKNPNKKKAKTHFLKKNEIKHFNVEI